MSFRNWVDNPDATKRRVCAMGLRCPVCGTSVGIRSNGRRLNNGRSYKHAETPECRGHAWYAAEYLVTDAELEAARG